MADYTVVIGLDNKHAQQLKWVWPTWVKNKPSLLKRPFILFGERDVDLQGMVDFLQKDVPRHNIRTAWWPFDAYAYYPPGDDKWTNPQRCKMLSGFVHVPAKMVETEYWLKIDTDAIAVGNDDWVNPEWFVNKPAIVCHKWTFTKPPDQMMKLDKWVADNSDVLSDLHNHDPLNLIPTPGSDRLGHSRIASWCGFFKSDFTRNCSLWSANTVGGHTLPVGSQDGYMWYCAKRMELEIVQQNMKTHGWTYFSTNTNIRKHSQEVLDGVFVS